MTIRMLPPHLINQIAAGEVIERPASVVKEIVENALDAGSTDILIELRDSGKSFISIKDNGAGMSAAQLPLAVIRHATSKIPDNDLFKISSLGFRGEALASIGAIARLSLHSRQHNQEHGWCLCVHGGELMPMTPSMQLKDQGTCVEVADLFYATPARLKFMKSNAAEMTATMEVIHRLALSAPHVSFKVIAQDKVMLNAVKESLEHRVTSVLGKNFGENALPIFFENDVMTLKGFVTVPTYNHSQSTQQFFFVNERPVKDKLLYSALKIAYQDYIPHGRHGACCLFLTLPSEWVDMNVHPAKVEVRFQQPQTVRDLMYSVVKGSLKAPHTSTSTHLGEAAVAYFEKTLPHSSPSFSSPNMSFSGHATLPINEGPIHGTSGRNHRVSAHAPTHFYSSWKNSNSSSNVAKIMPMALGEDPVSTATVTLDLEQNVGFLGIPKAQLFESYIITQGENDFFIVDQHAAAERLTYEQLKLARENQEITVQPLLIPEILALPIHEQALLLGVREELSHLGVEIDTFGKDLVVRSVPTLLKNVNISEMMHDILEDLRHGDYSTRVEEKLLEKLSRIACHGSIRFGRALSMPEMSALLRQMEAFPLSAQCNHGRPSFIKLSRTDLSKLFERA